MQFSPPCGLPSAIAPPSFLWLPVGVNLMSEALASSGKKKKIQHCEFSTGQCSLLLILLQSVPSENEIKQSLCCSRAQSLNRCKTSALESLCSAQEMGLLQGNVLHSCITLQHSVTMPHCSEAGLLKFEWPILGHLKIASSVWFQQLHLLTAHGRLFRTMWSSSACVCTGHSLHSSTD